MLSPTPTQSLLGGLGLSLPVYFLLLLNGKVFGISGFLHRAVKGGSEDLAAVSGLILGGAYIGLLDGRGPGVSPRIHLDLGRALLSGFLVGFGTKMSNGCTSGHMLCGVSRFSLRSFAATASFVVTGAITAQIMHSGMPPAGTVDWTLGDNGQRLLISQAIPLTLSSVLCLFAAREKTRTIQRNGFLRTATSLVTAFHFALALCLSNLVDPSRVVSFLLLPSHPAFDPSLVFLALGGLPLSMTLYRLFRPKRSWLGGIWEIPSGGAIDSKLLLGAAIFGVGWGMSGICPGPGLVNFSRAIFGGGEVCNFGVWLVAMLTGGSLANTLF